METKVIGGNLNTALNSWAKVVIRYSVVFIDWTKLEIQKIDRKSRRLMALRKGLHSKSNVGKLFSQKGGRELISVDGCNSRTWIFMWDKVMKG